MKHVRKKARAKKRQRLEQATARPPAPGAAVWLYSNLFEPGASPMLSGPQLQADDDGDNIDFDGSHQGGGGATAAGGYLQVDEFDVDDVGNKDARELSVD